jgi:hypothetical protein
MTASLPTGASSIERETDVTGASSEGGDKNTKRSENSAA